MLDIEYGHQVFIELSPDNGFNPEKLLAIPEICVIGNKNDPNHLATELLWDMRRQENNIASEKFCASDLGLRYKARSGAWQFFASFGQGDVMTCNIRLCANTPGNICQRLIEGCGYAPDMF